MKYAPFVLAAISIGVGALGLSDAAARMRLATQTPDMAVGWDERMRPLIDALPRRQDVVGYVDELFLAGSAAGLNSGEFALTEYAVAPILLRADASPQWIIGSFGNALTPAQVETGLEALIGPHELTPMGFGYYLIQRRGG